MKKLNQFLKLTLLVFLFTLPFLIGCAETEREMMFPDTDLPESATVTVEVPAEAAFKLIISTDYRKEKDNFGNTVIIHNSEKEYSVTQDFSETISFDSEEPRISVKLTCTKIDSMSENSANSVHLIVQFNGDGNFNRGNHNHLLQPIQLGSFISVQSVFSRYEGVSNRSERDIDPDIHPK
ncbi:hypothetical protein C6501_16360 [Candidatus Poribacteria bacterium]|nr:MAG: hypothetical protein C6501_16360 [Candidatus Poribacteria bacterium]